MRLSEIQLLSRVKNKGQDVGNLPNRGRPIKAGREHDYLGNKVLDLPQGLEIWREHFGGQVSYNLFDTATHRVMISTFGSRYKKNPSSYIIAGVYAQPGNPMRASEFYRLLITELGLTLVSDRSQSPGGLKVWQQLERYPDVNIYGYNTRTGDAINVGAHDTEMTHVPSDLAQKPEPGQRREIQDISRNVRLVAVARGQQGVREGSQR